MAPLISLEEVKKHRRKSSVWIVIHNDVYDVTNFLKEHPGGEDSLMDVAGEDGTQDFEDAGHSNYARDLLKEFKIGTLKGSDDSKDKPCCPHLPKMVKAEKTWRTFDRPASSPPVAIKSEYKIPTTPKTERRVQSITVPRERTTREPRPRGQPCNESTNLKWAILALAGALVIGIVLKKYLGNK